MNLDLASSIIVEAIACSTHDALIAQAAGADRLEVCSAIALGGLTPSAGTLIAIRRATTLPLVAMIRPRQSGFCYTSLEFEAMLADAEALIAAGADALVFGYLDDEGDIDVPRCKQFLAVAGSTPVAFHRAFDATTEPIDALEALIDLGIRRILTSGQAPTALQGVDLIRRLIERAEGRIEIIPGGGVRPDTAKEIVAQTGATQVHLGPFTTRSDRSVEASEEASRVFGSTFPVADGETISKVVRLLRD